MSKSTDVPSPERRDGDAERTTERSRGRVATAVGGTRAFVRLVYRDPEHVTERMTLYAAQRLGEPSREWAQAKLSANPDTPKVQLADALRAQSANVARIDGAVAGTPFFIALVPGYVAYLWQEGRMALRTAALYGRDPSDPRTTAEMLALRGVHPTPELAAAALEAVRDAPPPPKPTTRRPLRVWVRAVKTLLIFGGFIDPPEEEERDVAHPSSRPPAASPSAPRSGRSRGCCPSPSWSPWPGRARVTRASSGGAFCSTTTARPTTPATRSARPTT